MNLSPRTFALLALAAAWGLAFAGTAATAWAEPFLPADPYYAAGYQWYVDTLGLPQAWDRSLGSPEVVIAVLDTGVMADVPDLAGRLLPPLTATGTVLDGTANHHGTWVATSVAMGVGDGIGGVGVGNFSILPVTVTNEWGGNTSADLAEGIRLAADAGARVITISSRTLKYGLLDEAAAYARTRGALTFVAADDTNRRTDLVDWPNLIFVAGTDRGDGRWVENDFTGSAWGPHVDLAAPAQDILIADPHDPDLPSGYGIIDGTSFAAPLAAGAAALVWSICPDLSPDEVRDLLYATAEDLGEPGWDEVFGHGRVDIGAAAEAAWARVPEPATLALVVGGAVALAVRRGRRGLR